MVNERYDFKKLTAKQIYSYMEANATPEQKKAFKDASFLLRAKKISEKVFKADGSPVMYQVKDKKGNPKFDEKGNPIMRQKIRMVVIEGGKEERSFSLLDAKWWFADNFPGAVENVPERGNTKEKESDIFKDW